MELQLENKIERLESIQNSGNMLLLVPNSLIRQFGKNKPNQPNCL